MGGLQRGNNIPRSSADTAAKATNQGVYNKPMMMDHIDYGVITEVDYSTYQVQVRLMGDSGEALGKRFWPLITRREEIFLKYGQLRKGMYVRVHWRGRQHAYFVVVEVVSDEEYDPVKQQDAENKLATGPFKLFSGGLIPSP